jgi:hypothetical protein
MGQTDEAKTMFERCLEAVQSMPTPSRRRPPVEKAGQEQLGPPVRENADSGAENGARFP